MTDRRPTRQVEKADQREAEQGRLQAPATHQPQEAPRVPSREQLTCVDAHTRFRVTDQGPSCHTPAAQDQVARVCTLHSSAPKNSTWLMVFIQSIATNRPPSAPVAL